jgi:phosphoserine phosphatase
MRWPIYKHVFFDCDSTLTAVEGIDVLAESTGQGQSVEGLTQAAMNGQIDLQEVYGKRLEAVNPTRQQIRQIRRVYKRNVVEDAQDVIQLLQTLGHKVYIISGGLAEPVEEFGVSLGVPRHQIRAVNVNYDQLAGVWWEDGYSSQTSGIQERYLGYDTGALTASEGKGEIVRQLIGDQKGRSLLIGDGHSDLLASQAVDLFTGYGGVVNRDLVLSRAPAFIHSRSLAPVLILAAGPAHLLKLRDGPYWALVLKTLNLVRSGGITFQNERLERKFNKALYATLGASR